MQKRGFLKLILASAAAPAIIKADSLMKIWVPPQKIQVVGGYMTATMVARQSLEMLAKNMAFMSDIHREWDALIGLDKMTIKIKQPSRYAWRIA